MSGYAEADHLYYKAADPFSFPHTGKTTERETSMKRQALAGFKKIIPDIEKMHDDSLAFYCYYKIAVLEHSFDSLANAMLYYEKAIGLLRASLRGTTQPDSLLFRPCLFLGMIQYYSNQFEPALINYKIAEALAAKYTPNPADAFRLYHGLGTMYYETANYSVAINYFQKAIALLNKPVSPHDTLWTNCRVNLMTAFTKLEKFNTADSICHELLKQDTSQNNILHSAGTLSLRLGDGNRAISFLKRVNYNDDNQVRLLNDIGQAYENIGSPDSARRYYLAALKENSKWPGKNADAGLALKYLGDFDTQVKSFNVALKKYQEALMQFVPDFNDPDVYKNPEQYGSVFSYTGLFSTLLAKANAFEKFYLRVNDSRKLEAALRAYQAAFRLADYVAKTYNGDDARLFLDKIKDTTRNHVIEMSLLLYQQTGKPDFLEDAYRFDQLNKVSVFSAGIGNSEISAGDTNLLNRQFSLRTAITRLSLKAAETTDSEARQMLALSIRDNELLLRKTQDELADDQGYASKHSADNIPAISQIQKELDRNTAVVSFHLAENGLLAFIITKEKFDFARSPIAPGLPAALDSFKNSLRNMETVHPDSVAALSTLLYNTLISPIRSLLAKSNRLVIIPCHELNDLPFEALRNNSGRYLIERFAVQYQYSTTLFNEIGAGEKPGMYDSSARTAPLIIFNAYDGQIPKDITSLWKADNKATSYIRQRLGYYLKKGLSKDKALQRAKTDLLSNAEIDPRFKSPVYWAHLVYAGQYQRSPALSLWWPLGSSVGVSFLIILLANLDSRRKRLRINDLY